MILCFSQCLYFKKNCIGLFSACIFQALSTELQHSIQELRIKIKQAKKKEEARACKKGLSQESILLAASILNVSTTDVEEILEDDEVSYFKDSTAKRGQIRRCCKFAFFWKRISS